MALQQEIIQALGAKPAIDANDEIRRSVDFLKAYLSAHPFLKTLVLRGGVLDGKQGWLLAVVNAQYTFNKYTELWALNRGYSEKT